MKKRYRILSLALLCACLIGCSNGSFAPPAPTETSANEDTQLIPVHEYDAENIDQSVASEIKRAYYQKLLSESRMDPEYLPSPEELWIIRYEGNFSGCEVVMMAGDGIDYTQALRSVEVASYEIVFASGQPVYVYKDGGLFTVKEAYDKGLISKSDVYSIGTAVGVEFRETYPTE